MEIKTILTHQSFQENNKKIWVIITSGLCSLKIKAAALIQDPGNITEGLFSDPFYIFNYAMTIKES